jgi:hypothetical protein
VVSNPGSTRALGKTRAPGIRYYIYAVSLLFRPARFRRKRKVLE